MTEATPLVEFRLCPERMRSGTQPACNLKILNLLVSIRPDKHRATQPTDEIRVFYGLLGFVELIAHAQYGLARINEAKESASLALPLAQESLKIYERLQHRDLAKVRGFVEKLLDAKEK